MDESYQIIVYPRLVPLKPFSLPRRDFFGIPGARSPVQDPVYILGTRDYQHGQPAKYIHWKASARHDRLQEKVLESTQQEKVLLVVDADPFAKHNAEEEFERTLEIVASLAARLDRKGHAVGLVTNCSVVGRRSAIVPMARNHQQLPTLLEVLARVQMKSQGPIIDMLATGINAGLGFKLCLLLLRRGWHDRRCARVLPALQSTCPSSLCVVPSSRKELKGRSSADIRCLEEIVFKKSEGK